MAHAFGYKDAWIVTSMQNLLNIYLQIAVEGVLYLERGLACEIVPGRTPESGRSLNRSCYSLAV